MDQFVYCDERDFMSVTKNQLLLENVNKSYGSNAIIRNLSCVFDQGCHVLLGKNGSGKSTLLKLIVGSEKVDSGNIRFNHVQLNNQDVKYKSNLGYASDKLHFYPFLTGQEFLNFIFLAKKQKNKNQIDDILEGFAVKDYLSYRLEEMSLGNQKKFILAAAFIGDPALMLFDEPTNEIDVTAKAFLAELLNKKIAAGKIIIFSSHDSDFLEKVSANKHQIDQIF